MSAELPRKKLNPKHGMRLHIAVLVGMTLASSAFALDLGLSVGNQILALGPYQSYYGAPPDVRSGWIDRGAIAGLNRDCKRSCQLCRRLRARMAAGN